MDCDFLILGGGIAGASAAGALAPLGRVVVWEAEDACGHHASGRSAALFEERYGAPSVVALNRASRADHVAGGWMSPRGLMLLGLAGEDAGFDADLRAMDLTEIVVADARARVPILSDAVVRAAAHDDAFDLDTDAMLQAGLRAAGEVATRRRVTALSRIRGGWEAVADGARIAAHTVVNAAGAWADDVARLAGVTPLGLVPLRRSMARLRAPGGRDVARWR